MQVGSVVVVMLELQQVGRWPLGCDCSVGYVMRIRGANGSGTKLRGLSMAPVLDDETAKPRGRHEQNSYLRLGWMCSYLSRQLKREKERRAGASTALHLTTQVPGQCRRTQFLAQRQRAGKSINQLCLCAGQVADESGLVRTCANHTRFRRQTRLDKYY